MNYEFDFLGVAVFYENMLDGLFLTVQITVFTIFVGIFISIIALFIKIKGNKFFQILIGSFVELIRNTPFIVQLFFIFFGLPTIGVKLSAIEAGIIAMVINLAAYSTEILRAGVEAVPKGQWEASKTLGLKHSKIFINIVLPQAFNKVSSSLISQCIIVMLGSSVLSQISVEELTFNANFIQSRTFLSFESYFLITIIYLILAVILRFVLNYISNKLFNKG